MQIIFIYLGILAGVCLEGEIVIIASSFAAHEGYLNIFLIIALSIIVTLSTDWFYFFLGRFKGRKVLEKRPKLRKHSSRINYYVEKYPTLILLSYRFLYGFRILTPLMIGMSRIRFAKFAVFSTFMTIVWVTVMSSIGYFFGNLFNGNMKEFKHIELYVFLGVFALWLTFILVSILMQKRRTKALTAQYDMNGS
jgi:membrane protein DedA with SNARE-associated domain